MAENMVLRCQFKGGQRKVINGLTIDSSASQLQETLFTLTGVPPHRQRILFGFPPRELIINDQNAALQSLLIKSGDTLIIEENKDTPLIAENSLSNYQENRLVLRRHIVPADNSCLFASLRNEMSNRRTEFMVMNVDALELQRNIQDTKMKRISLLLGRLTEGFRVLRRRKSFHLDIAIAGLFISIILSISFIINMRKGRHAGDMQYTSEEDQTKSKAETEKRQCSSQKFLNTLTKGKWIRGKTKRTSEEETFLDDLNLRRKLKLPETLYREDLRCGINFPIANSTLPSTCNHKSDHYCCNEQTGWCGSTSQHCSHKKSTNYREFVQGYNSSWKPDDAGCKILTFTRTAACKLMSDNGYKLIFIGDNQAHHLFIAYLIFLTGNSPDVLLKQNTPLVMKNKCIGDLLMFNPECRHVVHDSSILLQDRNGCGFNKYFLLEYFPDFQTFLTSATEKRIKTLIHTKNTYILLSAGQHFDSNHHSFINYYLKPFMKIKPQNDWPKVIIETLPKVPSVTISDKRGAFRDAVTKFCNENDLLYVDNFQLASNLWPFDGKHYSMAFHMLKVKILLNFFNKEANGC